jgi:hypothetical protein
MPNIFQKMATLETALCVADDLIRKSRIVIERDIKLLFKRKLNGVFKMRIL